MKTSELIEGLTILQKYRDNDGHDVGAEHDIVYAYPTDRPVDAADLARLREIGWHQPEVEDNNEGDQEYDAEEGWGAFV